MKYMDILMFIICFNVAVYFMAATGMFNAIGGTRTMTPDKELLKLYNATAHSYKIEWSNPDVLDYMLALGVGLWTTITIMFSIFFQVTLLAPTLIQLGVDPTIAVIIATPIYFIYLWGIIQFLSGKSGSNME